MRRFAALLPLILLVTACGPSAVQVADEYRPRAEKKLALVRAAAKLAADFNAPFKRRRSRTNSVSAAKAPTPRLRILRT